MINDHTTGFLALIGEFHENTGFTLSYEKTTVYRIGSLANSDAKLYSEKAMNWASGTINVLGIDIYQTEEELQKNYEKVVSKAKQVIDSWENRNISLFGKIQVINSLIASLFVYKMSVLPTMNKSMVKEFRQMCEHYIWNGKRPKIKYSTLQRDGMYAGAKLVDIELKDVSLKAAWVKIIVQGKYDEQYMYNMLDPEIREHIWCCNLKPEDAHVIKCANKFWKDVLYAWCVYHYSDSLESQDEIIWYNSNIRIKDTPVAWKSCIQRGLMYISQLMKDGKFISEAEAEGEFGLTTMQFNTIKSAIPCEIARKVKNKPENACFTDEKYRKFIGTEKSAAYVYKNINERRCSELPAEEKWKAELEDFNLCEQVKNIKKCTVVAKLRSFQYRLLHRAVSTNIQLKHWGIKESDDCTFCETSRETIRHMMYECSMTKCIWNKLITICEDMQLPTPEINYKAIILNAVNSNPANPTNLLCLVAKQYIYRQRCSNAKISTAEFTSLCYRARSVEKYYGQCK